MKRREFVTILGGAVVVRPLAALGQQPAVHMARIAYLGPTSPTVLDPSQIEGFKLGLRENGLVEGRNIAVEYLWAEGDRDRLEQLANDLAQRHLDVIVTAGPQ